MTTYRNNNFNLWITVNGNEQRIVNDVVNIPFGTEYAIRVRNNNSVRAEFAIEIDGLENKDRFIINPFETVTIERFLEGNLKSGSRFKFVSENDPSVQNPGSSQNGIVRVKFWKELIMPRPVIKWGYTPHWEHNWDLTNPDSFYGSDVHYMSSSRGSSINLNNISCCGGGTSCSAGPVGATVEGSASNQNFISVNGFATEISPTILQVTLRGLTAQEAVAYKYCSQCGTRSSKEANFCSSCGRNLN
jgi:hypothetical protein